MPWEIDGRRWHTHDRVGRTGEPCRWDGEILAHVVDRIHELGEFSETNWNSRGVVEIRAAKKSDGWFFHAITGEEWLLKLKFRMARKTFKREDLDRPPRSEAAQRPRAPAGLRHRAAGEVQEPPRAVAGSRDPRAFARPRSTSRSSGSSWNRPSPAFRSSPTASSRSPKT